MQPRTSTHLVNLASTLQEDPGIHDIISHDSLDALDHPVERGKWINARFVGRRQFYNLSHLQQWLQQKGTDPMTNMPVTLRDFDAVQWEDPPPGLKDKKYAEETERLLLADHGGEVYATPEWRLYQQQILDDMDEWRVIRQSEQHELAAMGEDMRRFREVMADWSWYPEASPVRDWVRGYWLNHPHSPLHDSAATRVNPAVQAITAAWLPPPDDTQRLRDYHDFRRQMATRMHARDEAAQAYWRHHPYDHSVDEPHGVGETLQFFHPIRGPYQGYASEYDANGEAAILTDDLFRETR
jgi:hypothetical protein